MYASGSLGQCYMRVARAMSWQQAWLYCRRSAGSSLVHVTFHVPVIEQKVIQTLLTSCTSRTAVTFLRVRFIISRTVFYYKNVSTSVTAF